MKNSKTVFLKSILAICLCAMLLPGISFGQEALLGEIRLLPFVFAPMYWLPCEGQILQIRDYQALYSLLGTTYGGDGVNTFALPDLRGRTPIHPSQKIFLGQPGGNDYAQVMKDNIPQDAVYMKHEPAGQSVITTIPPSISMRFCICVENGYYPDYSESTYTSPAKPMLMKSALPQPLMKNAVPRIQAPNPAPIPDSPPPAGPGSIRPPVPPIPTPIPLPPNPFIRPFRQMEMKQLPANVMNDPAIKTGPVTKVVLFLGPRDPDRESLEKTFIKLTESHKDSDISFTLMNLPENQTMAEVYGVKQTPTALGIKGDKVLDRLEGKITSLDIQHHTLDLKHEK